MNQLPFNREFHKIVMPTNKNTLSKTLGTSLINIVPFLPDVCSKLIDEKLS